MKVVAHEMTEELAVRLLGWKWMAFDDIPIKGTPGYPAECRVRQLFSAKQLANAKWRKYLEEHNASDATGEEPLSYTYCSSGCNAARLPRFTILVDECE